MKLLEDHYANLTLNDIKNLMENEKIDNSIEYYLKRNEKFNSLNDVEKEIIITNILKTFNNLFKLNGLSMLDCKLVADRFCGIVNISYYENK